MFKFDLCKKNEIRKAACKLAGWNEEDVIFWASGQRNGRPVWELIKRDTKQRFMFTAFDADDIYDLWGEQANRLTGVL